MLQECVFLIFCCFLRVMGWGYVRSLFTFSECVEETFCLHFSCFQLNNFNHDKIFVVGRQKGTIVSAYDLSTF